MKFTGAPSSSEWQWFDFKIGHQDSSSSNCHQGHLPYGIVNVDENMYDKYFLYNLFFQVCYLKLSWLASVLSTHGVCSRNVMDGDDNRDKRMTCTMNLLVSWSFLLCNPLDPGSNFQIHYNVWFFTDAEVNIGSGNGLVPPGTKPLPELMLTKFSVTIKHPKRPVS